MVYLRQVLAGTDGLLGCVIVTPQTGSQLNTTAGRSETLMRCLTQTRHILVSIKQSCFDVRVLGSAIDKI